MITKSDLLKIEKLLKNIRDAVASGEYIFRGETRKNIKISSKLYRELKKHMKQNLSDSDIQKAQEEMLEGAKNHTKEQDDDIILEELQHFGGSTNQIDFTTDYLIALFFACDGEHNKSDGRLIFLDKKKFKEQIHEPRYPQNRVIAQKSVFVRSPSGLVKVESDKIIWIDKGLKESVLRYLAQHHGIKAQTIYNDVHGYITRREIHKIARKRLHLGIMYHNQRRYRLAIKCYTQALEYDPSFGMAYNNLGAAYDDIIDYDSAIINYTKAIELNPKYSNAYYGRGNAYFSRGDAYYNKDDYNCAIADYTKVISLNPNHAEAYFNLGVTKEELQDFKGAKADLEIALRLAKQQGSKTFVLARKRIDKLAKLEK